ncbi:MAG: LPD7 domain-containing protein [Pseudomonadota bacterium]|nr:LPD7 domain-containing protein [Pseudomonadota bacterium]
MSWIDRAVQRITSEPPWTYQADSPTGLRADARRLPEPELEPEGFATRAASQPRAASPGTSVPRATPLDTRSVPEDVRERFVRMGRYYYFPGGNVAFEDKGKKVVTRSENTEVVRSLVEIAQARGWQDITVAGTERFRREAWRQATYAGLIVRGYQPTEQDKRQFVRDLAKARAPQEPPEPLIDPPRSVIAPPYREMPVPPADAAREAARATPSQSQMAFERAADSERERPVMASDRSGVRAHRDDPTPALSIPEAEGARSEARRGTRAGSQRSRLYAGRLIEHGEARYKFRDDKEPSYFVRLETANGPKDLWGVDFPRALNQAGVKEGDLIEVELTGRKSVAVKRPARDAQGHVLGEEEVAAHRNEWDVRQQERGANGSSPTNGTSYAARSQALHEPSALARESARENPALTNALATLRAAELLAEARIPDAAQRTRFVEGVRAQLAQVLDNDATPPAPQVRGRAVERVRTPGRVLS